MSSRETEVNESGAAPGTGDGAMAYREIERQYALEVFPKRDITIVKGRGAEVWDDQGLRYIDCVAGIGVASVGHANPAVADALAEQARTLVTCPGIFYNDVRARLLEKLAAIAPGGLTRGFLCNSGAEAVEAAIKFARLTTGRTGIVSAMRGFHGRTLGALSATYKKEYRELFEPLVPGFSFVPFNNAARLRAAVGDDTAAVVIEPVQGEGGIRPGQRGVPARRARDLRRDGRDAGLRRDPDGLLPYRAHVRVRTLRGDAGHAVPGQGDRRGRAPGSRVGG